MPLLYAFKKVFDEDWLPTMICTAADRITSNGEPGTWLTVLNATLMQEGEKSWELLKQERQAMGEPTDQWTLPYGWGWGPQRWRTPLKRELRIRHAKSMGLPVNDATVGERRPFVPRDPETGKKMKLERIRRFVIPTRNPQGWELFADVIQETTVNVSASFTNCVCAVQRCIADKKLAQELVELQGRLGDVDKALKECWERRRTHGASWKVEEISQSQIQKAPLPLDLARDLTARLEGFLPGNSVFPPLESRFEVVQLAFDSAQSGETALDFNFDNMKRNERMKIFIALTEGVMVSVGVPTFDVKSRSIVCTRYRVSVPVGAALVVWCAMSTAFSMSTHLTCECLYGEVARPGACAPEDVRATPGQTFLQVME